MLLLCSFFICFHISPLRAGEASPARRPARASLSRTVAALRFECNRPFTGLGGPPTGILGLNCGAGLNLAPETIGNVIGGSASVGAVYWFVCLRRR